MPAPLRDRERKSLLVAGPSCHCRTPSGKEMKKAPQLERAGGLLPPSPPLAEPQSSGIRLQAAGLAWAGPGPPDTPLPCSVTHSAAA